MRAALWWVLALLACVLACVLGCASVDDGRDVRPAPDAGADAATSPAVDAGPCEGVRVDALAPARVLVGQAHNTMVTAHGCFAGVRHVEVRVADVPFVILDGGRTLVFLAAAEPIPEGSLTLPFSAQVDLLLAAGASVQTVVVLE